MAARKVRRIVRDSRTGRIVRPGEAKRRPSTTQTETIRPKRVRRKK